MTDREKWVAVFAALDKVCEELAGWPRERRRSKLAHLIGYSRERGRRPVVKDDP